MGVTDDGLLAGMAAGDAQATAAFVRRYQARVFGLALSIVNVPAVAEDVAQEAFVRAWRFAGGYDPRRGGVVGWLLAITRNAAIDARRLARDQPYDPQILIDLVVEPDRPDGPVQVTYEGKPLYTFTDDSGPGHADGNGFTDTFNGTDFQWHAAAVSGSAPAETGRVGDYGDY